MLRALVFLTGLALVVVGVGLMFVPAGFIVGGLGVCGIGMLLEVSASRREAANR